jgi:hypothetical protein
VRRKTTPLGISIVGKSLFYDSEKLSRGKFAEPQKHFSAMMMAADRDDASEKNVAMENKVVPSRSLLGELYLAAQMPREALAELEASPKDDAEPVPDDRRHRHRGGHRLGRGSEALLPKGHDPRDFALFAFGGAGPLHAVEIARELGIPTVLVPRFPGITSVGMLGHIIADSRATSPRICRVTAYARARRSSHHPRNHGIRRAQSGTEALSSGMAG